MDRGAWQAILWGRKESDTTEPLTLSHIHNGFPFKLKLQIKKIKNKTTNYLYLLPKLPSVNILFSALLTGLIHLGKQNVFYILNNLFTELN